MVPEQYFDYSVLCNSMLVHTRVVQANRAAVKQTTYSAEESCSKSILWTSHGLLCWM